MRRGLNEIAETDEGRVPLAGDGVEVTAGRGEVFAVELPDSFAAMATAADKTGVFHDAQVFGDRLTSDFGTFGEAGDGQWTGVGEAQHEA